MQKLSSLLKTRREELNISLERVASDTKIRKDFLEKIEEGNFKTFSSLTHLKGFIKIYSKYMYLEEDFVMALFRREMNIKEEEKKVLNTQFKEPKVLLTQNRLITFIVLLVILGILMFLGLEFKKLSDAPTFNLVSPVIASSNDKEVSIESGTDSINILGSTNKGTGIYINGKKVNLNNLNQFKLDNFKLEGNETVIKAINQFGIEKELKLILTKSTVSVITGTSMNLSIQTTADLNLTVTIDGTSVINRNVVNGSSINSTLRPDLNLTGTKKIEIQSSIPEATKIKINEGEYVLKVGINTFELVEGKIVQR